jgi:murein DD-endopeptidase MepM/ murein hydrolase activator NlpD
MGDNQRIRITLKRPVGEEFKITAGPGDKGGMWRTEHRGYDFACPVGTPVAAPLRGNIFIAGRHRIHDRDSGEWIDGPLGLRIWQLVEVHGVGMVRIGYCHLSFIDVKEGEVVEPGTIIGATGNTGNSTGPHIHVQAETFPEREILEVEWL